MPCTSPSAKTYTTYKSLLSVPFVSAKTTLPPTRLNPYTIGICNDAPRFVNLTPCAALLAGPDGDPLGISGIKLPNGSVIKSTTSSTTSTTASTTSTTMSTTVSITSVIKSITPPIYTISFT